MVIKRGRPRKFDRTSREKFAVLIARYGLSGAREAAHNSVSLRTLQKIAREFDIRLQAGKRPAGANCVPPPALSEWQHEQLRLILARGAQAAGYRTANWTPRRIADVVQRSFDMKCVSDHLTELLLQLGFRLSKGQALPAQTKTAKEEAFAPKHSQSAA